MLFICLIILTLFSLNIDIQQNVDSTTTVFTQDSLTTKAADSVSTTAFDSLILIENQSSYIAYVFEKNALRAVKVLKKAFESIYVQGRFPIHIIIFVICLSLVIITSIDAIKKKTYK